MTQDPVQHRDEIFVKGFWFLSFTRNMEENIRKNEGKNLSAKDSQKLLDNTKQSVTDALKTSLKRVIQN